MRILEINKFNYSRRGADKHFIDVVRLLKSKGHTVAEFSMRHPKNRVSPWSKYFLSYVGYNAADSNFSEKIKGAARMFYSFEAKRKINLLLDEFRPDVVHIHNVYHQLSPCILFEIKKRNIPIVMTVHDYKIINPNHSLNLNGESYDRCRNGKYYQCFLDKCVKNSYAKSLVAALEMYWHEKIGTYRKNVDAYIVPSNYAKTTLVSWGLPAQKINVLEHFTLPMPENSNNTDLNSRHYALYFGSISAKKGVDVLLRIFKKNKDFKLYLAGMIEDGYEIPEKNQIKYLGELNQRELQNYIKKCLFVISASRLPETFGLAALEANAFGKPFVGLKTGALPEIIENGENGFLADTEAELSEIAGKIIRGEIKFDSRKITEKTLAKYGQERYYSKLSQILRGLTK